MKRSIVFFFLLVLPFISNGQGTQYTGAPTQVNAIRGGAKADSAQWLPIGFAIYPWFDSTGRIWYSSIDSSLYYHTGHKRVKLGSGGGGGSTDTTSLSHRIDLKINKSDSNLLSGYFSYFAWLRDSSLIMNNFTNYATLTQLTNALAPYATIASTWSRTQIDSILTAKAYETISHAASTYYPLTNPTGYITNIPLADTADSVRVWANGKFYPASNPSNYVDVTPTNDSSQALRTAINTKVSLAKHTADSTQFYLTIGDTSAAIRAYIAGLPNYGISTTDTTHWNTAYNKYITGAVFNSVTGNYTLTLNDATTITTSLDGRYLRTETDPIWVADSANYYQRTTTYSKAQIDASNNAASWVGIDTVDLDGDSVPYGYGTNSPDSVVSSDISRLTNTYINNTAYSKSFTRDVVYRRFKNYPAVNVKRPSIIWVGMNDLFLMPPWVTVGSENLAMNGLKTSYTTLIANTFLDQFFPVSNISKTGAWVNLSPNDSLGSKSELTGLGTPYSSSVSGSTLSLSLKGNTVVIGTFAAPDTATLGRFSVTIDGNNYGIYNPVGQCADTFFYNYSGTTPLLNRVYTPSVFIVSGLTNGIHNVAVTTLDNKRTYFDYIGTMGEPVGCAPLTLVHINRNRTYKTSVVDSFNAAIDSVASSFRTLGYKIAVVKTENYIDTSIDLAYQIHLNDTGHRHIAYGILQTTKTSSSTLNTTSAGYGITYNATAKNYNLDTNKAIIQGGAILPDTTKIYDLANKGVTIGVKNINTEYINPNGITSFNTFEPYGLQLSNYNNGVNISNNSKGNALVYEYGVSTWYENALRFVGVIKWNLATDNTNAANSISKMYLSTVKGHSQYSGFILSPNWNESANPIQVGAYGIDDSVNYIPYAMLNVSSANNTGSTWAVDVTDQTRSHLFRINDQGVIYPTLQQNSTGAIKIPVYDTGTGKLEMVRVNTLKVNKVDSLHISNDSVYYCKNGVCTFSYMRTSGGGSGTVTSVATSKGILGGTITGSGTLYVDTTGASGTAVASQAWVNNKSYLTGNQTVTLSGDVTGSGTTAITTTIGAGKVTNTMLAGSIDLTTKVTGALPSANIAATLTSKRITPRIGSTASSATPTPDGDNNDVYEVTALAVDATFAAPSGTPTDGQPLLIRIKDNGTSRTLAWNAIYRAGTDFALPTSTTISKTVYIQFVYNSADSKWDAVGLTSGL